MARTIDMTACDASVKGLKGDTLGDANALKQHHRQAYDFFRANHRSAKDK